MSMLKPLADYRTPTKKQQKVISELFSIDEKLVVVIVPTQKLAKPLLKFSNEIKRYKAIKSDVLKMGLDESWLKLKLGNSIVVGKRRWKKLIEYLQYTNLKN